MQKNYQIDNLDKSILSELLLEARTPYAKIAEQLDVSAGTIHVRIEKMRQAGIIAAAGLYAFEHNVGRLAEDHANAKKFAELIDDLPGVDVSIEETETNMVFFEVEADAREISSRLEERGVRIGALNDTRMRAVTHLDVTGPEVETAAQTLREILS